MYWNFKIQFEVWARLMPSLLITLIVNEIEKIRNSNRHISGIN